VLSPDTETPVVSETSVGSDLLQSLQILTELVIQGVGENLGVLAINNVALTIEEPGGNFVLGRVLNDGDDTLKLFGGELSSTVG
jgi:hypothetical protein